MIGLHLPGFQLAVFQNGTPFGPFGRQTIPLAAKNGIPKWDLPQTEPSFGPFGTPNYTASRQKQDPKMGSKSANTHTSCVHFFGSSTLTLYNTSGNNHKRHLMKSYLRHKRHFNETLRVYDTNDIYEQDIAL